MSHLAERFHLKRSIFVIMFVAAFMIMTVSTFLIAQPLHVDAAAPKLSIQFTCAQAVDHHSGSVCVHTQVRAALTIKVKYCSHAYATSRSLKGTQHADAKGNYRWNWTPDTKCRGAATAYVTETFSGKVLNASKNFTVK